MVAEPEAENVSVYMRMYWGDYLGDTLDLTAAQHGAYLLLVAQYWLTGKPLPDDKKALFRITRLTGRTRENDLKRVLLYFFLVDHKWFHKRIERELARARAGKEKQSKAGKVAANARWESHANRIKNACESVCENDTRQPSTVNTFVSKDTNGAISEKSREKKSEDLEPKENPAPLWPGCVFFRMDSHQHDLTIKYYTKEGFDLNLIGPAIQEVDLWLQGKTLEAKRARKNPTHYGHLKAVWVIDKAQRRLALKNSNSGRPKNQQEKNRDTLDKFDSLFQQESFANDYDSADSQIVEVSVGPLAKPENI